MLAALVGPTDPPGPTCTGSPPGTAGGARPAAGRRLRGADRWTGSRHDGFVWPRRATTTIRRYRDGLVLDGQGLSPLVLGAAKLLPPSSRTDGDRFWLDQTRNVHTATAAAYGVITAAAPDDRATQLDLRAAAAAHDSTGTGRGIELKHMNQITERIDREATTGAPPTFAPRFAALLPAGGTPLLTFRVGHPERDAVPTPRRGASDVLR